MKWIKASDFKWEPRKTYYANRPGNGLVDIKSSGHFQESDGTFFWHEPGIVPVLKKDHDDLFILDEQDEGWVPVGERLPEKRIRVNACLDGDIVFIGHLDFNGQWVLEEWDLAKDGSGQSKVTHWQPLPKPPATKD